MTIVNKRWQRREKNATNILKMKENVQQWDTKGGSKEAIASSTIPIESLCLSLFMESLLTSEAFGIASAMDEVPY